MPKSLRLARALLLGALALYWCVIAWGTHTSSDQVGEMLFDDKVLHFGAFFGLVVLLSLTFLRRRKTTKRAVLIVLVAMLYGVLDEVTQAWIPGRHATVADWLADCLGSLAGIVAYFTCVPKVAHPVPENGGSSPSGRPQRETATSVARGGESVP